MKALSLVIIASLIPLTLIGCAQISEVNTNLDQENFTHYFSPTEVKIFRDELSFQTKSKMLGMVEGEHCQLKAHHAVPDEIEARTMARRKAYQLGANAIVFSGCAAIEKNSQCHAAVVCYGKAYFVEDK